MITVKEENDKSFTIEWDPEDSILNSWTEEDFLNCICEFLCLETD